jgi:hypothetical protein
LRLYVVGFTTGQVIDLPHGVWWLQNRSQIRGAGARGERGRRSAPGAEFLQDRRIYPSFVPPPQIRSLRDLLRHRARLLEQRNQTHNKIHDLFETANISYQAWRAICWGLPDRGSLKH